MLGIIIGVAAVITMIAVGSGATQRVQEQMKGLGSNIMLVIPGGITAGGVRLAWPREWEAHIFAHVPIDTPARAA